MKYTIALLSTIAFATGCAPTYPETQEGQILMELTPNLAGIADSIQTETAGIAVVNNANRRLYMDDWRRALLLDKPSVLSPYPIIDN